MENKTIEALEKLIQIKDDTIKELEKQISLLKNQPTINVPNFNVPFTPTSQPTQPYNPQPFVSPNTTPYSPLNPPWFISGGNLPEGSIQMGPNNSGNITITNTPNDPNATWTFTTSEGAKPIDWFTASRC